jgi:uncharacterized protein
LRRRAKMIADEELPVKNLVILFAKAPIIGRVKTRLAAKSSAAFAANLHQAFVEDLSRRILTLPQVRLEIHSDALAWQQLSEHLQIPTRLQCAGDLGQRMLFAIKNGLAAGYERVLILGADSPNVPLPYLETLLNFESDLAFGPAEDGGYYAIAASKWHPQMFDGVKWSTADALQGSLRAATAAGLTTATGLTWFDIDEYEDLDRLTSDWDLLPLTSSVIRKQMQSE